MFFLMLLPFEILLIYILVRKTSRKILMFLYRITGNQKAATYLFALLFLPGTFIHEMSHFLTGLFLLVPVGKVELFPEIEEGGVKMGSVAIGKTDPVRRTLIGIAPVVFGLAIILGSVFWVYERGLFRQPVVVAILAYLIFEVGNTMFSSKKDVEGALKVFIPAILVYLFLYFFGLRINFNLNFEVLKQASIFLLVPIIIDLLLLIF